ncbi:UNVERIFIED_CONTAM: hypothetical protein HDU68_009793 [Siphonaria sp. JEL0065]|nr:hypothetical protein HDU68_009793 [Siphonaria sp. JEL0065]
MRFSTIVVAAAVVASSANSLTLYEPADGKVYLGAWVDTESPYTASNVTVGGDSPASFNKRLGSSASVFHLSQTLPLSISPFDQSELTANLTSIEETKTDAILLLTIYPYGKGNPYDQYTDADINKLAIQLDNISNPSKSSRRVMVRFAPEFNGNWFSYGQQPTRFVKEFRRIVTAIRKVTNRVAFVWAPNAGNNYPFGGPLAAAEISVLDTNKNGQLDLGDDPFTAYWPGSEYVDWVGLSLYWKGDATTGTPPHDNSVNPATYWEQMVQGGGNFGVNQAYPFYDMFAKTYNKPLMMPEGGAAFALSQSPSNTTLPAGAGRTAVLQAFWKSYLSVLPKYPKAKMFINFEFIKILEDPVPGAAVNNGVTRDYRITWDADTLAAFKSDVAALGAGAVAWANPFVGGTDPLTIGGPFNVPASTGAPVATKTSAASLLVGSMVVGLFASLFI